MNPTQTRAVAVLASMLTATATTESWLRLSACVSCAGDLFDFAADALLDSGFAESTIVMQAGHFVPALRLAPSPCSN